MTDTQRARLPDDILYKLSKGKKALTGSMSFNEACYVLNVCLNKKIVVMALDEDEGISMVEFTRANKAKQGKISNKEMMDTPRTPVNFILADRAMFESAVYLSHAYTTDIWRFVNNLQNVDVSHKAKDFGKGRETVKMLARLITNYDMYKKRLVMELNISTAQLYALLYFAPAEKLAPDFYNKDFKYAYNANRSDMYEALRIMEKNGQLFRRGKGRKIFYSLTSAGYEMLDKVLRMIIKLYKI